MAEWKYNGEFGLPVLSNFRCILLDEKEVKKVRPYFETKVVKVKKEKERYSNLITIDGKKYKLYEDREGNVYPHKEKGNWVNGGNLDAIKFPCFCSYTHGSKKMGILSKLGDSFYIIDIDGQADNNKYFLSYDLKHLIKDFNIHILKGKIILFEEEE